MSCYAANDVLGLYSRRPYARGVTMFVIVSRRELGAARSRKHCDTITRSAYANMVDLNPSPSLRACRNKSDKTQAHSVNECIDIGAITRRYDSYNFTTQRMFSHPYKAPLREREWVCLTPRKSANSEFSWRAHRKCIVLDLRKITTCVPVTLEA